MIAVGVEVFSAKARPPPRLTGAPAPAGSREGPDRQGRGAAQAAVAPPSCCRGPVSLFKLNPASALSIALPPKRPQLVAVTLVNGAVGAWRVVVGKKDINAT